MQGALFTMRRIPEERIERVASLLPKGLPNDERKGSAEELDMLARILIDAFDDVHSSSECSKGKSETKRSAL